MDEMKFTLSSFSRKIVSPFSLISLEKLSISVGIAKNQERHHSKKHLQLHS
jgi:hypothetical protein